MNLISLDLNYYFTEDLIGIIIGYVGNPEKKNIVFVYYAIELIHCRQ